VTNLEASGAGSTPGHFTLDARRVRERLRDFQLPDRAAYVLLLVQAAVLRGARSIRVTASRRRLTLAFDGAPFSRAELDTRYDRLLDESAGPADASLRRLCLGLHGLLAFDPRARVDLRSGDGRSGISLALDPGHEDARAQDASTTTGTIIAIRRRTPGPPRDAELIATRCRHAPVEVLVNGQSVTAQPWATEAFGALAFDGPCGPAQAAVEPLGPSTAELRIVQHGVVIQVLPMPQWPGANIRVAARADGLPTDLTGFALLDGPERQALLAACDEAVRVRFDPTRVIAQINGIVGKEEQRRLDRLTRLRTYLRQGTFLVLIALAVLTFCFFQFGVRQSFVESLMMVLYVISTLGMFIIYPAYVFLKERLRM
jgi:hypothetical protein